MRSPLAAQGPQEVPPTIGCRPARRQFAVPLRILLILGIVEAIR
jgi:hypothetical protein